MVMTAFFWTVWLLIAPISYCYQVSADRRNASFKPAVWPLTALPCSRPPEPGLVQGHACYPAFERLFSWLEKGARMPLQIVKWAVS